MHGICKRWQVRLVRGWTLTRRCGVPQAVRVCRASVLSSESGTNHSSLIKCLGGHRGGLVGPSGPMMLFFCPRVWWSAGPSSRQARVARPGLTEARLRPGGIGAHSWDYPGSSSQYGGMTRREGTPCSYPTSSAQATKGHSSHLGVKGLWVLKEAGKNQASP